MYNVIHGLLRGGAVNNPSANRPVFQLFTMLLAYVIYMLISGYVGMYIWNNVLTKVTTIIKPITSVYDVWLLMFLSQIFFPTSTASSMH